MMRSRPTVLSNLFAAATCMLIPAFAAQAQQIVPDGRTQTSLHIDGTTTDVSTATVRGNNAFNSFDRFNVDSGNVVNLQLPNGTDNLINIVHSQRSDIHGVLNSLQNGSIGGNVYFANPHGVVVGAGGLINVGSLSISTPTQPFADGFFAADGTPSAAAIQSLMRRSAPLNSESVISIDGEVNAHRDVDLFAGTVENSGTIQSGARFAPSASFADVVNVNDYELGTSVAIENGEIVIHADNDVVNTGIIAADGGSGVDAGSVAITAGRDITLTGDSVISARGRGVASSGGDIFVFADRDATRSGDAYIDVRGGDTGDGGVAELSAERAVVLDGGGFRAGAPSGRAGYALVDPDELTLSADDTSDGGDLSYSADSKITVGANVTISSRNISAPATGNHLTAVSEGNSGDITLAAPQIVIADGAEILAQADSGFTGGDVSLNAVDAANLDWSSADFAEIDTSASITVGDATLKGRNITLDAIASTSKLAEVEEDLDDQSGANLKYEVSEDSVFQFSLFAASVRADSTAQININSGAELDALNNLTVNAEAAATAEVITLGLFVGVTYGRSRPTAGVVVADGASLSAGGDVTIAGTANATLNTTLYVPASGDIGNISVAYGRVKANSTVDVQDGATIEGTNVDISSLNSNEISVKATGFGLQLTTAGFGFAVGVGDFDSNAKTTVAGDVTATGDLSISSTAHNLNNDVRAATLILSPLQDLVGTYSSWIGSIFSGKSSTFSPSQNPKIAMGAAVTYVDSVNRADAIVANGALLKASDDLTIAANAEDNFQASASGAFGNAQNSASGAVVITDYDNKAYAYVETGAAVAAGAALLVDAFAEVPNQVTFLDFDKSYPDDDDRLSGGKDFFEGLVDLSAYLSLTLGLENKVATNYVHAEASSTYEKGGDYNLSAMLNLLSVDNYAYAYIDEDVQVNQNQDATFATDQQSVTVHAEGSIESINLGGLPSILNPKGWSGYGADTGLGALYNQVSYDNHVYAYIDDGASIDAKGNVEVSADTHNYVVQVDQAGTAAADSGVTGVFATFLLDNDAIAYVDDEVTVDAGGDVTVSADTDVHAYTGSGSVVQSKNVGVGLAGAYVNVDNQTKAFIGNADDSTDAAAAGTVTAGGNVNLSADTTYDVYTLAVSAAVPGTLPSSPEMANYGLAISGDAIVNIVDDTTKTWISDVTVDADGDLSLYAHSNPFLIAGTGSIAFQENTGIGGSYSHNQLDRDTQAYITNAKVTDATNVTIHADTHDQLIAVAIGASGSKTKTSAAGSVTVNDLSMGLPVTTKAGVGSGSSVVASGNINIQSEDELDVVAITGTFTVGGTNGFGAALDFEFLDSDVEAYIDPSVSVTTSGGNLVVNAEAEFDTINVVAAIAGGLDGWAGVGSATTIDENDDVKASIGDGAVITVDGSVAVVAESSFDAHPLAGGAAYGSTLGIGASIATLLHDEDVLAWIGKNADITARGKHGTLSVPTDVDSNNESITGLAVTAISREDVVAIAAGGATSYELAAYGSFAIQVLDETTRAYIDEGTEVFKTDADSAQSVYVIAADNTFVLGAAGTLVAGTQGGIGGGIDGGRATKTTEAYVADDADIDAKSNVQIRAFNEEDVTVAAAVIALSGEAAGNLSAPLFGLYNTTTAYIGDATVAAEGSVLVSAQDDNEIDAGGGGFSGSGEVGVGATVGLVIVDKDTKAYIDSGAEVDALATRDSISAPSGEITISYVEEPDTDGGGEVNSSLASNTDIDTPMFLRQRQATFAQAALKGVGVVAISADDLESVAVSGAIAGEGAVSIAAAVAVIDTDTQAYIDGAQVNQNTTGVGAEQSVRIAAGSDIYHLGIAGAASGGGTAGVGPGFEVFVATPTTKAYISGAAAVSATEDVTVWARTEEAVVEVGIGLAGGGTAGVAGSIPVLTVISETEASIGGFATVDADGNVWVNAEDETDATTVAGAAGLAGSVGFGASVSVGVFEKDTKALIEGGADVTGRGNSANTMTVLSGGGLSGSSYPTETAKGVAVQAIADEDVNNVTVAGGAGADVGVGGAVSVNYIDSDTVAGIGFGAEVNADNAGAGSDQSVRVAAANVADLDTHNGSVGGGLYAGISGAVDVMTVRNSTTAYIGDSTTVAAKNDVTVDALSDIDGAHGVVSGALGAGALAGAIGVYSFGNQLSDDADDRLTGNGVQSYADEQTSNSTPVAVLNNTSVAELQAAAVQVESIQSEVAVSAKLSDTNPDAGTQAFIGNSATINAGDTLRVNADTVLDVAALTGAAAIGALGGGFGIGVLDADGGARAYIGSQSDLSAGGALSVMASVDNTELVQSYAGSISLGALEAAVAIVDDESISEASIGAETTIAAADSVSVTVNDDRDVDAITFGAAIGAISAGASVAKATIAGSSLAALGDEVEIGQSTSDVGSVLVKADTYMDAYASAGAASAGIGTATGNDGWAEVDVDTEASIGVDAIIDADVADADIEVEADAKMTASGNTLGVNIGAVAAGASDAHGYVDGTVTASVGSAAALDADDDVRIEARYNANSDGTALTSFGAFASASSTAGALVGGVGATAATHNNVTTAASAGAESDLSGDDVSILARANLIADSYATGQAYAVLAAGVTESDATVTNNNTVNLGSGATIDADGAFTMLAKSNVDVDSNADGGSGGIAAVASTDAASTVNDTTQALIGSAAVVDAEGDALVQALTSISVYSDGDIDSGGLVTFNLTEGHATVSANTLVSIGNDATVSGENLSIHAKVELLDVDALARSKTFAVDSTTWAKAFLNLTSPTNISIGTGVDLTGAQRLELISNHSNVDAYSKGKAEIGAGITGVVKSEANNTLDTDSNVSVGSGSTVTTSTLYVEAKAPQTTDGWRRDSIANAQTVVNYIVKSIEVLEKSVSWIPFLGSVVKWVTKTITTVIEEVLHSDTSSVVGGSFASDNAIDFRADIYQSEANNPRLVVGADGTIQVKNNVDATVANGIVTVDDVINGDAMTITFYTPGGTLSGSSTAYISNAMDVTLTNNSNYDMQVNDIQVVADNGDDQDVAATAETNTYTLTTVYDPSASVLIDNNGVSDVILLGQITNAAGDITIDNAGGSILGGAGHLVQGHALAMYARNGSLGSALVPLSLEVTEGTSASTLALLANDDLYAGARAVADRAASAANATAALSNVTVGTLKAGDTIVFTGRNGHRIVTTDEGVSTTTDQPVTYAFTGGITAGGDITLTGEALVTLLLDSTLTRGVADIAYQVNANGSIDANAIDYAEATDDDSITLEDIVAKSGTVSITGTLAGTGTIRVLNGYSHVDIDNASNKTLIVGDIDLPAVTTQVTINSATQSVPGQYGSIALISSGYATGVVDIDNTGSGNVELAGHIRNPSGTTAIDVAIGSLLRRADTQLITSRDVVLNAGAAIGSSTSPIRLDLQGGSVDAGAQNDIALREINGDLLVGAIVSSAGDVELTADNAIVDAANDANADVSAINVALVAEHGGVGSPQNRFDIDSSNPSVGELSAQAQASIFLTEVAGDLRTGDVISSGGDIDLSAPSGNIGAGHIAAANNIALVSWGSILDGDGDAAADVEGRNLLLTAGGGIGSAIDALEIDSARGGAGVLTAESEFSSYLTEVAGDLSIALLRSKSADVTAAASDGAIHLGKVEALVGTAHLQASADIDAVGAVLPTVIDAASIDLASTAGSIGTIQRPLDIESGARRAGAVSANAAANVFLNEVSNDLVVDRISGGTMVALNAPRSIVGQGADDDADIAGGAVSLYAGHGSIGTEGRALRLDSGGEVALLAFGSIDAVETAGDLTLSNVIAGAPVHLQVVQGNLTAETIRGSQLTATIDDGNAHLAGLMTEQLDLRLAGEGAQATLGHYELVGRRPGVSILADRILIEDLVETRSKVQLNLRGNDGGVADAVEIHGGLKKAVFMSLQAINTLLDVHSEKRQTLKFKDMVVVNAADLHISTLDVHVGPGDDTPFDLMVSARRARLRPRDLNRILTVTPRLRGASL